MPFTLIHNDNAMDAGSFPTPVLDGNVPTFSLREGVLLRGPQDGHGEPQSHMPVSVMSLGILVSLSASIDT